MAIDPEDRFRYLDQLHWQPVFQDPGTGDWRRHWFLDGEFAQVDTGPEGMTFHAGPQAGDHAHHAVLWTHESFAGDLRLDLDFTRLDDVGRYVCILYLQATGTGDGPYAADITAWSDRRREPYMSHYYQHMNLLHISFAAYGAAGAQDYVRCRRYPVPPGGVFGTDTALKPDYSGDGLFARDVPHHFTVIKHDQQLFFTVRNAHERRLFHWDLLQFPAISAGRVGIRQMFARSSRYSDISISRLDPAP